MSTVPSSERRGLGRGLEVLIGGAGSSDLAHVPVDQIHPNPRQPRKRFDHEATAGLAESIRAQGIIQPVVLRPRPAGGYELIAGERRWRAAREAKLATLPALVRDAADRDALLLGLVENVAREELSPVEEAREPFRGTSHSLGELRVRRRAPALLRPRPRPARLALGGPHRQPLPHDLAREAASALVVGNSQDGASVPLGQLAPLDHREHVVGELEKPQPVRDGGLRPAHAIGDLA